MKIDLRLLLAACKCAAKADIREYMNFVHIKDGAICSSNGFIAFYCPIDGIDVDFNLVIPPQVIAELAKATPKKYRDTIVEISIKDEFVKLSTVARLGLHEQAFINYDRGNMVNVKKLVDELGDTVDCMPSFNWHNIMIMQQINEILDDKHKYALIRPTGKEKPAKIEFTNPEFENAVGIVMPCRIITA